MKSEFWVLVFLLKLGEASSEELESKKDESGTGRDLRIVWQLEVEQVNCCNGGTPVADGVVRNLTVHTSDYTIQEQTSDDQTFNCRNFQVKYLAKRLRILSESDDELDADVNVHCKCPDLGSRHILDSSCRRLPLCKNTGFRSPSAPHHCICPQPFFGDRCDKYCDQGQRLKGHNGKDYCSCVPFFQGEECRDMLCLNGGREDNGRCICPQQFLGYHCEIDTNRTGSSTGSRFQRFGDQSNEMFTRDISGTIFSLIMIVVLVVSMYLLMKHRMQTRYLNRRPDLLGACNFPVPTAMTGATIGCSASGNCMGTGRRDHMQTEDPRLYSFRPIIAASLPDSGPPPYLPSGHRGRRLRNEVLPPLPSYEDATKLPPLRSNVDEEETDNELNTQNGLESTRTDEPVVSIEPATNSSSPVLASIRGNEMIRSIPIHSPTPNPGQDADTGSIGSSSPGIDSENRISSSSSLHSVKNE